MTLRETRTMNALTGELRQTALILDGAEPEEVAALV